MSLINFPILYIPDPTKGRPLFSGQIFVGEPDTDPQTVINQKQLNVVEENGTVVPVSQPFTLSAGGVPVYNGNPVRLDVDGNYSIKILNKQGTQAYYIENVYEGQPVTSITLPDLLINDLSQAYEFDTLAAFKASTIAFPVGKVISIADITSGDLIDSLADIVLTSSVVTNDRNIILSTGVPAQSIVLRPQKETYTEFTWYVDPINGSDTFGKGVSAGVNAYKTIQYAWDQLPSILNHQQTIQLADGTYNENYVSAANQPRPAILWGHGKVTTFRSSSTGSGLTGALVIKGNSVSPQNVVIQTTSDFNYGVYINKGNIGLQDLYIESDGVNKANTLLVSHRTDTYIQCFNVVLDGKDVASAKFSSNCAVAESNGQIEFSDDCTLTNADVGVQTLVDGDNIVISGSSRIRSCGTGASIKGGFLKLSMTDTAFAEFEMIETCTTGVFCVFGRVEVRGATAVNRAIISSPVILEGARMEFIFSDLESTLVGNNGSDVKFDSADFQRQLTFKASSVYLRNSNSYTDTGSPNNTDVLPVALLDSSDIQYEGTNNIVGSGGSYVSYNPLVLTYVADSTIQATTPGTDVYKMNGSGANRLTCEIEAANVEEGRTIHIDGDTWGVELTSGTNMDVPVNFTIGSGTGHYGGATLTMRGGLWRVNSPSLTRP